MPLYIYNSLSRKKEEFKPLKPKQVKMYVCGPTVYDEPHIGHIRSAYIFDVIRRYLMFKGYRVEFVRNVTDVDDKIINKAREEFPGEDLNSSFKKVAEKYLKSYHEALKSLGIESEGIDEPRASEYIPKMIKFIQGLVDKAAAYVAGGDVYFDITKAKNYGKLSNQSLDRLESGARILPTEHKKDPLDFALWKAAKENEPSWESPWGRGRPAWHIECSVMSSDILGDEFDIHGGGIDLIFPHHENEVAQSEAAGEKFARYWLHHGLLTINGQKMSKSLGNFVTVEKFLEKYKDPDLLKLLFLSVHYSHPVDYNDAKIQETKQALERIDIFLNKSANIPEQGSVQEIKEIQEIKSRFEEAMDDDFNTPKALACIFDLVNAANKNINEPNFIYSARRQLKELSDILGLSLSRVAPPALCTDKEIESLIAKREKARKENNYELADSLRKELEAKGIILEDAKGATTWRRKI